MSAELPESKSKKDGLVNAATASSPIVAGESTEAASGLIEGGKIMSLMEHLDELRKRLVRAVVAIVVLFFVFISIGNMILDFLKQPLVAALPKGVTALHFTGPMDVMFVQMKVAFLASIIAGAPIWLYQFWKFFEPALYPKERRYIFPFIVASSLLFLSGIAFCYYAMLPIALKFLIGMGMEVGSPIITVTDYISLLTLMFLGFGIAFETPIILILLSLLGIIDAKMLSENRTGVSVGILIIAAVLTPPDPISQFMMAIPMYLLFEISIIIIKVISSQKEPGPESIPKKKE